MFRLGVAALLFFPVQVLAGDALTLELAIKNTGSIGMKKSDYDALSMAGKAYGICEGMNARQTEINGELDKETSALDSIYNFSSLLLHAETPGAPIENVSVTTDGAVLPPVLTHAQGVYDQKNDDLIRVFDDVYRIIEGPRLVYAPPNWRSYLIFDYSKNECSRPPIRPSTTEQESLWASAVSEGWNMGRKQADMAMEINLNRLKRDFEGRVLYHVLLRKGMVSAPVLAMANVGVTGNPGSELNINERVYRITARPAFDQNTKNWLPTSYQFKNAGKPQ